MDIKKIEGCTRTIGEAQGYIGLPLRDVIINSTVDGPETPAMESAWSLSPVELAALAGGGSLILQVLGRQHPPVMLYVEPPPASSPAVVVMPPGDALVACGGGQILPAMFFYAIEGANYSDIAKENGFNPLFVGFEADDHDTTEAADAWIAAYDAEPDKVLAEWMPSTPDGYTFGGKWHTEDGLCACFLRPIEADAS